MEQDKAMEALERSSQALTNLEQMADAVPRRTLRPGILNNLAEMAHKTATEKGWQSQPRTFGDVIALIHTEPSEALEEYRKGKPVTEIYWTNGAGSDVTHMMRVDELDEPKGVPIEFADTIIRVLQASAEYGIDIDEAVRTKMHYNSTRPHRHGGKLL